MAQAMLLLVLCIYFSGSGAQFVLTQPPSVSASPGETVSITCARSSGSISGTWNSWYQHTPGRPPVLVIYTDTKRPSGIPSRISGSIDKSSNTATLTITGVQPDDEADYYCLTYDANSNILFGSGTHLTVLGQPKASPTVHLFPPSSEELSTQSKATLVCLMDNFYPGSVQVTWKADGAPITSGVETTKPSKQSNNQYMASSYLKLSASEWKSHESYTCLVTHDGKSTDKTLKRSECS